MEKCSNPAKFCFGFGIGIRITQKLQKCIGKSLLEIFIIKYFLNHVFEFPHQGRNQGLYLCQAGLSKNNSFRSFLLNFDCPKLLNMLFLWSQLNFPGNYRLVSFHQGLNHKQYFVTGDLDWNMFKSDTCIKTLIFRILKICCSNNSARNSNLRSSKTPILKPSIKSKSRLPQLKKKFSKECYLFDTCITTRIVWNIPKVLLFLVCLDIRTHNFRSLRVCFLPFGSDSCSWGFAQRTLHIDLCIKIIMFWAFKKVFSIFFLLVIRTKKSPLTLSFNSPIKPQLKFAHF